jgi:hypothetical protein
VWNCEKIALLLLLPLPLLLLVVAISGSARVTQLWRFLQLLVVVEP